MIYAYKNVKLGADPELFFVDNTNTPRSAEGLLGGDKNAPVPMKGLAAGFFLQEDNVTAEFNIPPSKTADAFATNIFKGLKYIDKIAQKNKLRMKFAPELDFPPEQLQTKHCLTFGCNPDYNIWSMEENPTPVPPERMRTAAGHVHIGWEAPTFDSAVMLGRFFDLFVTVPSIIATKKNRRRQLYGKAGASRIKPYGIECRSVDNFWLGSSENTKQVFNNTMRAVQFISTTDHRHLEELLDQYAGMIIPCINEHQQDVAEFLCHKFDIPKFQPHVD